MSVPDAAHETEPGAEDFRALADSLPQLAWMADGAGSVFWYNRRWYEYTGTTREQMYGWGWRSVHHPDHVEAVTERIRASFATGEPWEDTFPLLGRDGTYRWFLSRARPLRGADGTVVRWFGTNTDITEQRKQEAALFRSERRFRSLIDATASIVWVLPPSGEMETEQPSWAAFTGQSFEEYRGWGWLEAIHPDDRAHSAAAWGEAVETRSLYDVEYRIRRHDGAWRWMSGRAAPVVNDRGELREWVGINVDIEVRKLGEEELAAARDQAQAANEAKSQFIANMSHELRTPLSAVIGYSEMLEEEVEELGEHRLLGDLRKINSNARHLLTLISDVLDLSKIEANRMTVFAEPFDVAELVDAVASTVDSLVRKRNNELVVEKADGLGAVFQDQVKLRQCLFNLLGNAAKFTESGRIGLRAEREVRDGAEWVRFTVSDSGIGMSTDQLGRLFERFTQADESTTRRFGGTGLGLSITKGFAELLGGGITVGSTEGEGSVFTLSVPAEYREAGLGDEEAVGDAAGGDGSNLVLLIDDDPTVRELVARFLHREGFQVRSTGDGRSGLALARSLRPRVVLLDVMMPQMDGWSVLEAVRNDPELAGTPVVMISFVNEPNLAASLGASGYLTKPVSWEELRLTMERFRADAPEGAVLVVDDDPGSRERMAAILRRNGMATVTAQNGAEALEQVRRAVPPLILLDLMMPEMDGFAFLETLRAEPAWADIPVVVITAKDIDAEDRRRLDGKADRLVSKGNLDLRSLAQQLHGLIGSPAQEGVRHAG